MRKSKKNFLSIAAALAISSTMVTANYIPLTTTANDGEWVLFGAAGFKTDGAAAAVEGEFRITGAANTIIDTLLDDLPVSGLTAGTGDLALLDSYDAAVPLEVRVDLTAAGVVYVETEPFRTMYVDTNGDGAPNFAFTYKASLEGQVLEYTINGGLASSVTINYQNTFDNPIAGVIIQGSDAIAGTELSELGDTNSIVDYDFAGNPPLASQYDDTTHRTDPIGTDTLRLYQYNAVGKYWEIHDNDNIAGTNDFDTVTAGKGYWGKMTTTATEAGFVFGTPGLTTADYTSAELRTGWNLMAFDGVQSSIRYATTGLLLTFDTVAGGDWDLEDSTGNHRITITNANADTNIIIAKNVNDAIETAKLLGTLPYTFDLRAFPTSNANQVAIVSNKKFSVYDVVDEIDAASTIAGQIPIDPTTSAVFGAAVADAPTTGITSVYGEYSTVIEPLIGAGTAQPLAAASAAVFDVFGDSAPAVAQRVTVGADAAATATAIGVASADFTGALGEATAISLDLTATEGHVLMSSVGPFKIRDATFSRVYAFNAGTANDGKIQIDTVNNIDITLNAVAATGAGTAAGEINVATGSDPVAAAEGDNVVIINNGAGKSEFPVYEYGTVGLSDIFQTQPISTDLARGAVKAVFSLDYLANKEIRNDVVITIDEVPDNELDTTQFNFTTQLGAVTGTAFSVNPVDGTGLALTYLADETDDTDNAAVLSAYVDQINTDLAAAGITATASYTLVPAMIGSTITVSGPDITDAAVVIAAGAGPIGGAVAEAAITDVPDLGYIGTLSADLALDLRYNQVLSPNYVMDGPLYTMRDNNLTLKALVTGTMDLSDGLVSWDSIDLTRLPSEWLDSQDYDLFTVDPKAGYWAYLEENPAASTLDIGTAVLSNNYIHHFDEDGTTYNTFSGTLDVEVTGITTADAGLSARVTATINGKTVELANNAGTNSFTGSISTNEINGLASNTAYEVFINVADGLGNKLEKNFPVLFDNVKPVAPTVTINDGTLSIAHADVNVTGFYVFGGVIPEVYTAGDELASLATAGDVGVVCESMAAVDANSAAGGLTVIAFDQNGTFNKGNASDSESVAFMPILKSRAMIIDTNIGADVTPTADGVDYNASCSSQGAITTPTGVSLAAITDATEARLAYASLGAADIHAVPVTEYLLDGANMIRITYPSTYTGDHVFVQIDGTVHGYILTGTDTTSGTPTDITGLLVKTGISL